MNMIEHLERTSESRRISAVWIASPDPFKVMESAYFGLLVLREIFASPSV